uniref:DUF4412 domain-containing protein n=1 Tax=candidate division WOR-3 bacterium TaxID=2052148 RepID=A0A7C2P2G6_UNCW3
MERVKYLCMILFASLIFYGVSFSDVYLEYKSFPSGKVLIYLTKKYMRMDAEEYGIFPVTLIYDKNLRKIFILNRDKKSYVEVNEKLLKDLRKLREEMEAQLSNLPPSMREMAKHMMMPGCVQIKEIPDDLCESPKIIGTENFRGLSAKVVDGCKNFDVEKNSFVICRYWFVDGEKLNLELEDFKTLISFLEFEWEFVKAMGSFCGTEAMSMFLTIPQKTLTLGYDLPIPVKVLSVSDEEEETMMILDNVSTNELTEELFRLPKNYKKIDIEVPKFRGRGY